MKLCSISDIHITPNYPERLDLFKSFCRSEEVKNSQIIVLLGDIFDHMTGNKKQYQKQYSGFFNELKKMLDAGKTLYVVEGNHDFHTDKIYGSYFKKNIEPKYLKNYHHIKNDIIINLNNKRIYIGHGDVLDYDNEAYKKWKSIYTSKGFRFLVSYIIPYRLAEKLGMMASKDSKQRNAETFNFEESKGKYRIGFEHLISEKEFDIALTGHTHIQENYTKDDKKLLNNGFFPSSKSFIYLNNEEATLVKLKESSEKLLL